MKDSDSSKSDENDECFSSNQIYQRTLFSVRKDTNIDIKQNSQSFSEENIKNLELYICPISRLLLFNTKRTSTYCQKWLLIFSFAFGMNHVLQPILQRVDIYYLAQTSRTMNKAQICRFLLDFLQFVKHIIYDFYEKS